MTKQRRQAMGMWVHDVDDDVWDPWDGSIKASGCPLTNDGHGALVISNHTAYEVHRGHMFRWSHLVPDDAPIADNASQGLFFTTCNLDLHITFQVLAGGNAEMHLHEGVSACADGGSASVFNMARPHSSRVSSASMAVNPTVDPEDIGTMLAATLVPGGTGPKSGGGGGDGSKWVFSASQTYLIFAVNRAGGDQPMSIAAEWHEEEPD